MELKCAYKIDFVPLPLQDPSSIYPVLLIFLTFSICCYVLFSPFHFLPDSCVTVPRELRFLFTLKKYTFQTGFDGINSGLLETCGKPHKSKKCSEKTERVGTSYDPLPCEHRLYLPGGESTSCTELPSLVKFDLNSG